MAAQPLIQLIDDRVPDDGRALPYRRTHGYVPPYYPDRGEGTRACALKLFVAIILLIPAAWFVLISAKLPIAKSMTRVERSARFLLIAIGAAALAAPGVWVARCSILPVWKRWKSARLREEQVKPLHRG